MCSVWLVWDCALLRAVRVGFDCAFCEVLFGWFVSCGFWVVVVSAAFRCCWFMLTSVWVILVGGLVIVLWFGICCDAGVFSAWLLGLL